MKNVRGLMLLASFCSLVVLADEVTVNEFLDWASTNGYGTYTNWADRPDEGVTDVVIAAVNDDGIVIQEGLFDSRTQEGNTAEREEPFTDWLRRWGFVRCRYSCDDDPRFSTR